MSKIIYFKSNKVNNKKKSDRSLHCNGLNLQSFMTGMNHNKLTKFYFTIYSPNLIKLIAKLLIKNNKNEQKYCALKDYYSFKLHSKYIMFINFYHNNYVTFTMGF